MLATSRPLNWREFLQPAVAVESEDFTGAFFMDLAVPDHNQTTGCRIRQRLQENAVEDAEYGSVGSGIPNVRVKNERAESRRAAEQAECVREILHENIPPRVTRASAEVLLQSSNVAESPLGGVARLQGRATALLLLFLFQIDVRAKFLFDIVVALLATLRNHAHFKTPPLQAT